MDWKKAGVNFGMFLTGLVTVFAPVYFDLKSRIDSGKDEQRSHWVAERLHKDSTDKIFEDSVLYLLNK